MDVLWQYLRVPADSGLNDHEVNIEGLGFTVLKAPQSAKVKVNSRLSEGIPLINIETVMTPFRKLYFTSEPDEVDIELIVYKSNRIYVDANSQYSVVANTAAYLEMTLLTSAIRGNYVERKTLDASAPTTIQSKQTWNGKPKANIISFTPLSDPSGWQVQVVSYRPDTLEPVTSLIGLDGILSAGDTFHINAISLTFIPSSTSQNLDLLVEYLFTPIWR